MQRLLIVDDDIIFVNGMEMVLKNEERIIYKAHSVKEAVAILKEEDKKLDLICSDYQMHDGTFIDLMEHIKKYGIKCPVIVISGHSEEEYVEKIKKAGAVLLFDKGFLEIQKIRKSVSDILRSVEI